MSGVDLRVNLLYKHIFNKQQLNKEIAGVGKDMAKHWASINPTTLSKNFSDTFEKTYQKMKPTLQSFHDKVLKTVIGTTAHESDLNKMWHKFFKGINKKGQLSAFLSPEDRLAKRRNPSDKTLIDLAQQYTRMTLQGEVQQGIEEERQKKLEEKEEISADKKRWKSVDEYAKSITKDINNTFKEYEKSDKLTEALGKALEKGVLSSSSNWSKSLKQGQKEEEKRQKEIDDLEMDEIEEKSKEDSANYKAQQKKLQEDKKKDDELRKKQLMLMLGKWGRLGVWGVAAQKALHYISAGVNYAYQTSMEGLDWQRTISGGASGGSWFGQGLAGYQRAGIGKANYQNFKRSMQSYIGSIKLGTGNAAPLSWLGVNALDNPDEIERQIERALRKAPPDESLAMAGMIGLDYKMWEAIYNGRISRERDAYSKDAIKSWGKLADSLNTLITHLNTFFFNYLAPIADFISRFLDSTVNKKSDAQLGASLLEWWLNPLAAAGKSLGSLVKFGAVEIIVKNENGDVIDKKTSEAGMEYNFG